MHFMSLERSQGAQVLTTQTFSFDAVHPGRLEGGPPRRLRFLYHRRCVRGMFSHPVTFSLFVSLNLQCATASLILFTSYKHPEKQTGPTAASRAPGSYGLARLPIVCPRHLVTAVSPCSSNPVPCVTLILFRVGRQQWGRLLQQRKDKQTLCHLGFR